MERFLVLPERQLLDKIKYADYPTACEISREHAERDGAPQYVVKILAVTRATLMAQTLENLESPADKTASETNK